MRAEEINCRVPAKRDRRKQIVFVSETVKVPRDCIIDIVVAADQRTESSSNLRFVLIFRRRSTLIDSTISGVFFSLDRTTMNESSVSMPFLVGGRILNPRENRSKRMATKAFSFVAQLSTIVRFAVRERDNGIYLDNCCVVSLEVPPR